MRIVSADGRRRRGDRSRAEILERVLQVASTDGFENVSFGRIANDLGLSKGNLTVLFGDKASLQSAAFDAAVVRFVDLVARPALLKRSANARLRALIDGWFAYIREGVFPGGCFMFSTAHEYRARDGVLREKAIATLGRWRALLEREFRAAGVAHSSEAAYAIIAYQNAAHLHLQLGDVAAFNMAHRGARRVIENGKAM